MSETAPKDRESRLVVHCSHYNVFLQRTIEDGLGPLAPALLTGAAMEAARVALAPAPGESAAALLARAAETFAALGFGRADIGALSGRGGTVHLLHSHYAVAWVAKWGVRGTPGCFFATGWFAGALAVAGGHSPERILARELRCHAVGAPRCELSLGVW